MHFNLVYLDHVEFGEFMTDFMFFCSPFFSVMYPLHLYLQTKCLWSIFEYQNLHNSNLHIVQSMYCYIIITIPPSLSPSPPPPPQTPTQKNLKEKKNSI